MTPQKGVGATQASVTFRPPI